MNGSRSYLVGILPPVIYSFAIKDEKLSTTEDQREFWKLLNRTFIKSVLLIIIFKL